MALNNLAFLAHDKGDLKTAIRDVAGLARDVPPHARQRASHPWRAGMNNLAMWLIEAGDFAAAEQLVREALEMRRKLLGPGTCGCREQHDPAGESPDRDRAL